MTYFSTNNGKSSEAKSRALNLYGVAVALLFFQPLFSSLFSSGLAYLVYFTGFMLAILLFIKDRGVSFDFASLGLQGMWAIVIIYICLSFVIGEGYSFGSLAVLAMSLALMLLAGNTACWVSVGIRVLLAMLMVFSVSTILMYVFPTLSDMVGNSLFAENDNFMGYQSGLTAHYSDNGLFNSVGVVISFGILILSESRKMKCVGGLTSLTFFAALIMTEKRAALVCTIIAMVAIYLSSNQKRKALKILLVVLIAIIGIVAFGSIIPGLHSVLERFGEALSSGSLRSATSDRTVLWDYAIRGWLEHPLFGNGWRTFYYVWSERGTVYSIVAHNELLHLLYETGIVGTTIIVVCMCTALASTIRLVSRISGGIAAMHLRISMAIQIFTLLYGFTMGAILYSPPYFCFYLFSIAIMLSYKCAGQQQDAVIPRLSILGASNFVKRIMSRW